jgi:prepilin-type N-terminal cleavage/methylation domain-containing protein
MKNQTDNKPARRPDRGARIRRAFTLVEVMISIALALLLMYGVSLVFKLSGDAVGANQAVAKIVRAHRSAQPVLAEDWRNCAADSPLFLISNEIGYGGPGQPATWVTGFRNAQEQRDNGDDDPTFFDGTAHNFLTLGPSDRIPRLDRLGFFARGSYRRETTPDDPSKALASSGEAYIWVGQLGVDNGTNKPVFPENQFGSDRILGRVAVLLKNGTELTAGDKPVAGNNAASKAGLWPLAYDQNTMASYSDVAPVTLDQFRVQANVVYDNSMPALNNFVNNWYTTMESDTTGKALRYWCNPTVTRPVTAQVLSSKVPIFVPNCTQFIVEYAGDYLNQDPKTGLPKNGVNQNLQTNGGQYDATTFDVAEAVNEKRKDLDDPLIVHGTTDGQIDYILEKPGNTADSSKWVRRIRWYGLPRDVNGDGIIDFNDVIPLADVLGPSGYNIQVNGTITRASLEKVLPKPSVADYSRLLNTDAANFRYICAWHNGAPPMIRILIKIDDPTGKLQDGQWYEYVLSR